MKILHVIPYMHPSAGGPPVVVDRWCVELQKLGHDVVVLSTDAYDDGTQPDWISRYRDRFPIEICRLTGPKGFGFSWGMKRRFRQLLKQAEIVHVHNLWSYSNRLAATICPRQQIPFVVSSHGMLDPGSRRRKRIKKQVYGRLIEFPQLRKSSGVLYTHRMEQELAERHTAGLPDGFVVPLACDEPPRIDEARMVARFDEIDPASKGKRRVLFLGRLHEKKGVDVLIDAFRDISESPDLNAHLCIVGPGEPDYVGMLKSRAEIFKSHVSFIPSLSGHDKWCAFVASDVFCLPSHQENFAIALVEALRCGCAVITTQNVNIHSDLVDAGAAVLCETNSNSVRKSIVQLLGDGDLREQVSQSGASFAKNAWNWESSTSSLEAAYSRCIQEKH